MSFLKRSQQILILSILFLLPFYFIKFKYGWASLNLVEILVIVLAAVWILGNRGGWESRKDWKKYRWPAIFVLVGIISSIFVNKNYYVGLGVAKGWFILPIIFAVILYDNLKKDEKLLDKIFIIIFASGAFVAVEGIYYWFSGLLTFDGRLRIFFDSPNQLAMYLAPIFLIGLKFGFEELRARARKEKAELWKLTGIILGLILIFFSLYLTKSYGAWLAVGLALVAIFWLRYRKIWPKKYLVIIIIIFIILITLAGFGKFENIKNLGERSSLASREMIWKSAGLMIQKNPIFGIGPGNFQEKYLEYQKYFPPYLEWAVPQPHNLYLAFWLESGLMGLVGFIWLLVLFFRDNKKVYPNTKIADTNSSPLSSIEKQARESLVSPNDFGAGASGNPGILLLAIVLYFLIHGIVDTTYWRNDMAILFWSVIAINAYLVKTSQSELQVGS